MEEPFEIGLKTDHMGMIKFVDGQGHSWQFISEYLLLLEIQFVTLVTHKHRHRHMHAHTFCFLCSPLSGSTKCGCLSTFTHPLLTATSSN